MRSDAKQSKVEESRAERSRIDRLINPIQSIEVGQCKPYQQMHVNE